MATYGKKSGDKVEAAMKERNAGTLKSGGSGKKVTSRKQAIAIGLSEARREGARVPAKKAPAKKAPAKKAAAKKAPARKAVAKKAPARKVAARKAPAKKTTAARKAPARKTTAARQAPARKAARKTTKSS
jgi:hypothetical protein